MGGKFRVFGCFVRNFFIFVRLFSFSNVFKFYIRVKMNSFLRWKVGRVFLLFFFGINFLSKL